MKIKNKTKKINKNIKIFALVMLFLIVSTTLYNNYVYRQNKSDSKSEGGRADKITDTNQTDKPTVITQDTSGSQTMSTSVSTWTRSKDDNIVLYSPTKNSLVTNTISISGVSKLNSINYRLIDNVSGVVISGLLNVVDGKFSGTISYKSTAVEGRLDVFSSNSMGDESNSIEVNLRFK